jgi:hypothetical protein
MGVSPLSGVKEYAMAERTEDTGHARFRGCLRPLQVVVVLTIVLLVFLRLSGCGAGLLFPQIVGQNCGEASTAGNVSRDPEKGELCLWHAYLRCRTATLVFAYEDVDTGSTHAITVQPGTHGCAITDNVEERGGHFPSLIVTTYQCTGLEQYAGWLVVTSCGTEGDVGLPPSLPAAQVGHLCGTITLEATATHSAIVMVRAPATVAGIESCFLKAYTSCTLATLIYGTPGVPPEYVTPGVTPSDGLIPLHILVVWRPFGTCLLTDGLLLDPWPPFHAWRYYDCAGLVPIASGGLVIHSCGAEGDLRLPAGTPVNR